MCDQIFEEWEELTQEYNKLESVNEEYIKKLQEITSIQQACLKYIGHQRYRMKTLTQNLKDTKTDESIQKLKEGMMKRETELQEIEKTLPRQSEGFLKFILGGIDVSFLNKDDKFKYKDEYEKFKLTCHFVAFVLCLVLLNVNSKPLEQFYLGFLIWYYCAISIRESILKVNGSRIKVWWRIHHILSLLGSGIMLVWSENETWNEFRNQFIWYNIYNSFIQYLQFKYQRGALYRLKALGEMQNMDITIEGFQYWMWRGLTFLLPFLFIGYIFQLTNAFVLFNLSYHPQSTWQLSATAYLFLVLFIGNTTTTIMVVPSKLKQKLMLKNRVMTQRVYNRLLEAIKKDHNS
ncbi:transmembrane protein 120 homolog [Leptinotarsa decemlineata]|uniref:transmembrane protein 120 homolog n=1 Tax=Leptinotarsa decemlineata TaxID=7539 RepID=UPI000C254941|nr:transmembrane protein 120 homolog [Leptinotarsa decemlineata]